MVFPIDNTVKWEGDGVTLTWDKPHLKQELTGVYSEKAQKLVREQEIVSHKKNWGCSFGRGGNSGI